MILQKVFRSMLKLETLFLLIVNIRRIIDMWASNSVIATQVPLLYQEMEKQFLMCTMTEKSIH